MEVGSDATRAVRRRITIIGAIMAGRREGKESVSQYRQVQVKRNTNDYV